MNPYLDQGYDSTTLTRHCADCEQPLFTPHEVLKDHILCAWSHFGYIQYPEVIATDPQTGKTLEGVVEKPARAVLTRIPHHSGLSFCLDCKPDWKTYGCGYCNDPVDQTKPHSRLEFIEKYTNGVNKNFQIFLFHQECLPSALFKEVHEYQDKFRPKI